MSAVGSWKVTLATPMGPQLMRLRITSLSDRFSGRIDSDIGSHDIEGTVSGNTLSWVMQVTQPLSVKVAFAVVVDGDSMRGSAKAGLFPKASVTGERLTGDDIGDEPSKSATAAGPVTGDSIDPIYHQPYVEINELRQQPVPHRYVHGGFTGTDARFSFYFPPQEQYQGRFFHNTYPMAVSADIGPFPIQFDVAVGDLGFTLDSGAYYVQTNLGGTDRAPPADPAIAAYRVNAEAAKYSRVVARELYGDHRSYGYLFGGSGGSYQVMGAAENTQGVWDGFLPYVLGTEHAVPSMFTIRMHALRVLRQRNRFPAIIDAIDAGGSGDPYAGLNDEERDALKESMLMGFPPRGWWNHDTLTSGYFSNIAPIMPMLDARYVEDFWTRSGYLGSDPESAIRAARFHFETTVARVIEGSPKQLELAAVPGRDFTDAHLVVGSGASVGKSIPIASINGNIIGFTFAADQAAINGIARGERVTIDNSWGLALQTYHRHQVPESHDLYAWNQFRGTDGQPIYPQRELLIGPLSAANTAGSVLNGAIHGKVLALAVLMDIDALPWQADWYRSLVQRALGPRFEQQFVLWFIDHAQHENPLTTRAKAHAVSFAGALQQGLRDLAHWVEQGVRPPDTRYRMQDSQVEVPARAVDRGGIQPVATLGANGGPRTEVIVGEPVKFEVVIEAPPGAGQIVTVEWDFEGTGEYPIKQIIDPPQRALTRSATYAYSRPGTYFAVTRTASQRHGDTATPYGLVQNLSRVRVVVC